MASIFKALDGGHLDRALFGQKVRTSRKGGEEGKAAPMRLSRRNRSGPRPDGGSEDRGDPARKPESDPGS